MRPGKTTANPRQAAWDTLLQIQKERAFADQLIDRELALGELHGPDRGLFAELVFGILRRQGSLDHILSQLVDQPLGRLEPRVLILLRLGLYQLVYLDRIPESAAVNESVKLAKDWVSRASGLVNAVLRNYLRRKNEITFPNPAIDPAGSIAARHSHPLWLVDQWLKQLGPQETDRLAQAASEQPPLTIRVNTLRTSREQFLYRLNDSGLTANPCRFSRDGIGLEGRHQVTELPGYKEGLFAVQDEASQIASLLLAPQPGERVLDACAAPGGKATHLAQIMENRGEVVASDIAKTKLALIQQNSDRLGIDIIKTEANNLLQPGCYPDMSFDRILLDAPCSGLGVIRRNPEAKWRLTADDIDRLANSQKTLLRNVAPALRSGGILLYSTCSTTTDENEEVVREFLSQQPEFVLEDLSQLFPDQAEIFSLGMFRAWPHRHGMDGFFAARLRKK